ncbi:MAG TPA: carboxymuconolactone decarboxylase family protein [Alphaproteobacteria bacterium]|jgi:alkylhydroperoxidase family enzyme|nr:carboxymuconolactone decarboxylase family protein [Alphaproteobacteria bacterium]
MRTGEARIPPKDRGEWDEEVRRLVNPSGELDDAQVYNIFKTLAHHPKLMKRWMVFANHILMKSSLPPREREMLILRIGWLCRAEYEWTQHVRIAKDEAGMTDREIDAVAEGPDSPFWHSETDRALLRAVDELHADAFITDATWAVLSRQFSRPQMMDIVATVGNYTLVSMMLNTFGVQLDEWLERYKAFPQG